MLDFKIIKELNYPHCSAIAAAMPGKVLDLNFFLSGPGDILCIKDQALYSSVPFSGGVNLFVGISSGSPYNSRPVALKALSPNHHGRMDS